MLSLKSQVPTLHEQALDAAKRFQKAEADLIEILQRVDERRLYLQFGCKSLFDYVVHQLHLSESVASNLIVVSRKAKEVPALKIAIQQGKLSVSKARKITPVLEPSNQALWLEKAKRLNTRKLEGEVAKVQPQALRRDRMRFVGGSHVELRVSLEQKTHEKLKRAQELINQKKRKACELDEILDSVLELYLEKEDPVRKAERAKKRMANGKTSIKKSRRMSRDMNEHRAPLPAKIKHQVYLRDRGACQYRLKSGERCGEKQWVDIHHIVPRSRGGEDRLDNLVILCSGHHKAWHS